MHIKRNLYHCFHIACRIKTFWDAYSDTPKRRIGWRRQNSKISQRGKSGWKNKPISNFNATIIAFVENKIVAVKEELASCVFIARYRWLQLKLTFDSQQITELTCPRFETLRARLQPRGVTLIFPSAYLNSPSSMFGHTLLRLDAEHQTE